MDMEKQQRIIEYIVKEIKKKFTNLTAEETIKLAHNIGYGIFKILEEE